MSALPAMTLDASQEVNPTAERFLTARELAEILSVHENYIYDLAARSLIPSYKIGGNRRFRWSEIELWLDSQRAGSYDVRQTKD